LEAVIDSELFCLGNPRRHPGLQILTHCCNTDSVHSIEQPCLSRLSAVEDLTIENLIRAIDPERELDAQEFYDYVFGDMEADPSEEYVEAFITGAQEFFEEVRDQI
jgi:hypothetical protein